MIILWVAFIGYVFNGFQGALECAAVYALIKYSLTPADKKKDEKD